ncbi:hypothetical protein IAQ61_000218 [Plenodomus lingam]|uniref:uncharacterized protein n=1 Tax=Leptosphaeria maculans TaxID=5022 RepID=UPI00331BF124|nr:hypothetical protein IAQ61_000218 [Plenodomus lingam]
MSSKKATSAWMAVIEEELTNIPTVKYLIALYIKMVSARTCSVEKDAVAMCVSLDEQNVLVAKYLRKMLPCCI